MHYNNNIENAISDTEDEFGHVDDNSDNDLNKEEGVESVRKVKPVINMLLTLSPWSVNMPTRTS